MFDLLRPAPVAVSSRAGAFCLDGFLMDRSRIQSKSSNRSGKQHETPQPFEFTIASIYSSRPIEMGEKESPGVPKFVPARPESHVSSPIVLPPVKQQPSIKVNTASIVDRGKGLHEDSAQICNGLKVMDTAEVSSSGVAEPKEDGDSHLNPVNHERSSDGSSLQNLDDYFFLSFNSRNAPFKLKIDRSLIDPTAWLRRALMSGTTVFCEWRDLEWFAACESRVADGESGKWTVGSDRVLKSSLTANKVHLTLVCGALWLVELLLGEVRMFIYENLNCNLHEIWKGVEDRIKKLLKIQQKLFYWDTKLRVAYIAVIDRSSPELLVIGIVKESGETRFDLQHQFLRRFAAGSGADKISSELADWRRSLPRSSGMVNSMWNLMSLAARRDKFSGGFCNVLSGSKNALWHCRLSRKLVSIGDKGAKTVMQARRPWAPGKRFLPQCQWPGGTSTFETGESSASMSSDRAATVRIDTAADSSSFEED